jgi:hypothetical protein
MTNRRCQIAFTTAGTLGCLYYARPLLSAAVAYLCWVLLVTFSLRHLRKAVPLSLVFARFAAIGAVRLSFLEETNVLNETISLLKRQGCSSQNCNAFGAVVQKYFASSFDYDLSRLPAATNGFYSFASMSNLVAALPRPLDYTSHSWGVNCYDTVILLCGGELRLAQGPDETLGTFFAPERTTNNVYHVRPASTPREAFFICCPLWCRELTDPVLPEAVREARFSLVPALDRFYRLPEAGTPKTLSQDMLGCLKAAWKQEGITFPKRFKVVLCHECDPNQGCFYTCHAGLLFRNESAGYMYIEKSGGRGPFVRLDFGREEDLLLWLESYLRATTASHFVTFNGDGFKALEPFRRNFPLELCWYVESDGVGHSGYQAVNAYSSSVTPDKVPFYNSINDLRAFLRKEGATNIESFSDLMMPGWKTRGLTLDELRALR